MKNKLIIFLAALCLTACGTFKKATTDQIDTTQTSQTTPDATINPIEAVIATLGDWQTMQTGGNISLKAGSSFSSAIQVRMVRDQAIYISLRPMLGIEVGRLLITADSLYAVDKVHKRYIAEKVSILTGGIPVNVSDVQDMFLGRPFVIGKGTLSEGVKSHITASNEGNSIILKANEAFKGYNYAFILDKTPRITSLTISPQGSSDKAYSAQYSDVRSTVAGRIAHSIKVNAAVEKRKLDFSLTYKNIEWNGNVKIDRSLPTNYTRMSANDLFSMFSN